MKEKEKLKEKIELKEIEPQSSSELTTVEADSNLANIRIDKIDKKDFKNDDSLASILKDPSESEEYRGASSFTLIGLAVVAAIICFWSFAMRGSNLVYITSFISFVASLLLWEKTVLDFYETIHRTFKEESRKFLGSLVYIKIQKLFQVSFFSIFATYMLYAHLTSGGIPGLLVIGFVIIFIPWLIQEMLWYHSLQSFVSKINRMADEASPSLLDNAKAQGYSIYYLFATSLFLAIFPMGAVPLIAQLSAATRKMQNIAFEHRLGLRNRKVVRYRPFVNFEKWIAQRFKSRDEKTKRLKFLIGIALMPLLLYAGYYGSIFFIEQLTALITMLAGGGPDGPPKSDFEANTSIVRWFLIMSGIVTASMASIYAGSSTHLEISEDGLSFLCKRSGGTTRKRFLPWHEIESVNIEEEKKLSGGTESILSFKRKAGEKPLKVNLNSIPSIEERQEILEAIEKFAPDLPRSSDVILALQLPAEHSYTELWLQALAAPPKREKLQPLLPDAVLSEGRYRIIRKLGAGGQGFAYLAFDNNLDAEVVLKEFILPVFVDMSVRKAALKEFEKEAKILSQLDHPQIVKLLDFMVEDHRAYLVLEHIDGDSLRDRVKKNGPLDEKQVEALAGQMCTVLENLHAQEPPVVHRDFTPDNLILHKDGTLKLIDFNVAHASDTTTIAKVVGKQAYLPPEQFRGEPCPQSDVYALGCTLHYLLTGSDPVPISQSDPGDGVSEKIRDLIKKATAIDLDDRYKSAAEIREDLAADAAAELESDQ